MDVLDEELLNFWKTMDTWKVQYIMVGGFATNLHGFSRMTADLDIWIKDTPDNRKVSEQLFQLAVWVIILKLKRCHLLPN